MERCFGGLRLVATVAMAVAALCGAVLSTPTPGEEAPASEGAAQTVT